jgi:hypothetical protein
MFSFSRTMFGSILTGALLSACSNDLIAPGAAESISASVQQTSIVSGPVGVKVRDSSLLVGDTVTVVATARNLRTRRDVTRDARFRFISSDTSIATVDGRGLVTAKSNGLVRIVVRSLFGRVSVRLSVGPEAVSIDTSTLRSLPDSALNAVPEPEAPPAIRLPENGAAPPFNAPMLPADTVDVTMPRVSGRSIRVANGDPAGLQAALNAAVGGDEIILPNNSEFIGNFVLPRHSGAGAVVLRSETVGVPVGSRVTPSTARDFARIGTTNSAPAIATAEAASNWRLVGLSVSLTTGATDNYGIITLGRGTETALSQLVSDIVLDRVMISGGEAGSTSRCVAFNGNALAVVNSWLADCHAKGRDAQGIGGWTGQGPFLIENNHIEGSGQAIMFGGADPSIANVTPSDATIRGNHLFKPLSWGNSKWTVKAAFELKHARRVLFEGNVIENHWVDAQVGFAILFQQVSQDNRALWSKVWDVTVRNNIIKNSTGGFNLLSRYTNNGITPNEPAKRILIRNNLFLDVGKDPISGVSGRMLQLMGDHEDVSVIQNTFFGPKATSALVFDGAPNKRMLLFNNLFGSNDYGIMGSGFAQGNASLAQFAPNAVVEGNALVGLPEQFYPARNSFPASLAITDFVSAAGGDYTLRSSVPFSANGGSLVGVDGQSLRNAVARAANR